MLNQQRYNNHPHSPCKSTVLNFFQRIATPFHHWTPQITTEMHQYYRPKNWLLAKNNLLFRGYNTHQSDVV